MEVLVESSAGPFDTLEEAEERVGCMESGELSDLREWQRRAFVVYPNIDLDIARVSVTRVL